MGGHCRYCRAQPTATSGVSGADSLETVFRFCSRYSGFFRVKDGETVDLEFRIGFGMMVGSFGMTLGSASTLLRGQRMPVC